MDLLDLVLLAICLLFGWRGYRQGFVIGVLSFAGLMASMGSMTTTRRTRDDMLITFAKNPPKMKIETFASTAVYRKRYGISPVEKTVNHTTVVYPSLPRNVDPIPWLAGLGYVKKPRDSSTYGRVAFNPSRSDSWRA